MEAHIYTASPHTILIPQLTPVFQGKKAAFSSKMVGLPFQDVMARRPYWQKRQLGRRFTVCEWKNRGHEPDRRPCRKRSIFN